VQPVSADDPVDRASVDSAFAGLTRRAELKTRNLFVHHFNAELVNTFAQRCVQHQSANPSTLHPGRVAVVDGAAGILIPDAPNRIPGRIYPEPRQVGHGSRHETFAAGFVDRAHARFEHDRFEPGQARLDCRG
jgi:hypothetical protein